MRHVLYSAALVGSALFSQNCYAAAYVIQSSATGATANVQVAGGTLNAIAAVDATSGAGYTYDSGTVTVASTNVGVSSATGSGLNLLTIGANVTAGVITSRSNASTTKIFHGVPSSVTGTTHLVNAGTTLTTKVANLVALEALGLTTTDIVSTSTAGYNTATKSYYTTGSSSIAGLSLDVGLLALVNPALLVNGQLNIGSNPAANTSILNTPLASLILNEQITSSGSTGASIETNAIHLKLNDFILNGKAVTADIILGHSAASVPEPASWGLMILGFGLVGGMLRSQRRRGALLAA